MLGKECVVERAVALQRALPGGRSQCRTARRDTSSGRRIEFVERDPAPPARFLLGVAPGSGSGPGCEAA
jgi:hypothetical protein